MAPPTTRGNSGFVTTTLLLTMIFSAALLLRQSAFVSAHPMVAEIEAPEGVSETNYYKPPSPLRVRAASRAATDTVAFAVDEARAATPVVPWGEFGLADVQIDPTRIRWDDRRERYISELDNGDIAILTLNRESQTRVRRAMAHFDEPAEAAVAIEPSTGRVLAFAEDRSAGDVPAHPARSGHAWAASTFKVITGAALLSEGAVQPDTRTCYHGGGSGLTEYHLQPNAELDTECLTFAQAMGYSANVIFARRADRNLTAEELQSMAERFAYNTTIPFEMPVERSRVAIPEDRVERARAAAGFQYSRQSPLHAALIQSAIANDGVMMVPTIVASIETADGDVLYEHEPVEWRRVLSSTRAEQLRTTMRPTTTIGTARRQFHRRAGWPASVRAIGKTGTLANRNDAGEFEGNVYTYSWFSGIGESEGRSVAVAGLVYMGESWQVRGAYLASEAMLGALR